MAGAALTTPYQVQKPDLMFMENYLVKTSEVINYGDLVGVDTNGLVVNASKTASAIVVPRGVAIAIANDAATSGTANSTQTSVTGDGTIRVGIARMATITRQGTALNTTIVPGLAKGAAVYLGAIGTSTVSNYTCTKTTTNGDALLQVGWVTADGLSLEIGPFDTTFLNYQTAGNSVVGSL